MTAAAGAAGATTVVLSRVPRWGTPIDAWYRDLPGDLILLTSEQSAPAYAEVLPDVRAFADYDASPQVVSELRAICGSRRVTRLVHATETDLLRAAGIRGEFGIPGASVEQLWPYRDKVTMKRRVAAAGLAVPDFAVLDDPVPDGTRFAAGRDRVVVKPRLGSASRGVAACDADSPELGGLLAAAHPQSAMIEEFVPGGMLHVDGFAQDGRLISATVSEYVNGCLAFQDSAALGSAQLDHGDPRRAAARHFARRVIAALPPLELSPYHLELFEPPGGGLVFCEIAARLGGGLIPEALTRATGQNPARLTLRSQAGLPVERPADGPPDGPRYGFLMVPPRAGLLTGVDRPEPASWLDSFHVQTAVPRSFAGATASTDTVLSFVCHAATAAQLRGRLDRCAELAGELARWAAP
jgi:hypothetical protein